MAEITLSKAVRSNLLSLQSTASLLGKTQERLATGLKVNSALDNPTNFFTASSLNSRASDLGRLLDSVSNAVQTISAADKGIKALTKLVETAQATARQALQTPATVGNSSTTAATAGSITAGSFSGPIDLNAAAATAGSASAGSFSAPLDFSGTAGTATLAAGDFASSTFGTGDTLTFDIAVDGGTATTVTISEANVIAAGNGDSTIDDVDELAAAINAAGLPSGVTAAVSGGDLVFTSDTTGSSSSVAISNVNANDTSTDGTITAAGLGSATSTAGDDASLSFDVAVDGGTATTVTIDRAAVEAAGNNDATIDDLSELASIVGAQLGAGVTVDGSGAGLVLTSATTGASSSVEISNTAASNVSNTSGIADTAGTAGTDAGAARTLSFDVSVDGGAATTVTIDAAAAGSDGIVSDLAELASIVDAQLGAGVTVDGSGSGLVLTSATTGATSSVAISNTTATGVTNTSGIADGAGTAGTAATSTSSSTPNPRREELREQYNELLGQIDQLVKDSGFNGVNLLNGDDLSVLFNEDGTSKLDISGVTNDAAGLGLNAIAANGFDNNAAVNATLDDLKAGIDTLRSQAAKFGANLSVVETRQDFTKDVINVLETGAANLTLADSNQEAANVLALQTRQQLSSTALSLASQADQQVLRLF